RGVLRSFVAERRLNATGVFERSAVAPRRRMGMFGRGPWAQAHGYHRCLAPRDGEKICVLRCVERPDAGSPPIRFGGRGGANAPSPPLSDGGASSECRAPALRAADDPAPCAAKRTLHKEAL